MRILQGIAELLAPTRCAGCELPGDLLCATCDDALPRIAVERACPCCGAPFGRLVCTECWNTTFAFDSAVSLGSLDGALARAVVLHKDAGERRLGGLLGELLAQKVLERWPVPPAAVTWIPATQSAVARRGFDHGRSLATPVAKRLGVPLLETLIRSQARDQRALGRAARSANAGGTFKVVGRPPACVLVVDDVLTTGATLDAAAAALLEQGAAEVRAAVVARAW